MSIDVRSSKNLEIITNSIKNKDDSLLKTLNHTCSVMGTRFLKSSLLQPSTDINLINARLDTVDELIETQSMLADFRTTIKQFEDLDRLCTLMIMSKKPNVPNSDQRLNHVILLKQSVNTILALKENLSPAKSTILQEVRERRSHVDIIHIKNLIDEYINSDCIWAKNPIELRNQRYYAVKKGKNGFLDVARRIQQEVADDIPSLVSKYSTEYGFIMEKKFHEFTSLDIMKCNSRIEDAILEINLISDQAIEELIKNIQPKVKTIFKIAESVGMVDILCSFAQNANLSVKGYVRPIFSDKLAIKGGRHPILEKTLPTPFIPNDTYSIKNHSRVQIIIGVNMSGKSIYLKQIALLSIMSQIGSFVPAEFATFPIYSSLHARICNDSTEINASSFSTEMDEMAHILSDIDSNGLVIVDELGRGSSISDGFSIFFAIAEALIETQVCVFMCTHFHDIPQILDVRDGVSSLHMRVDFPSSNRLLMHYKIVDGRCKLDEYGLKLAASIPFPPKVLDLAAENATKIGAYRNERHKESSSSKVERKRKLVLDLVHALSQVSQLEGIEEKNLRKWCLVLQRQFIEEYMQTQQNTD